MLKAETVARMAQNGLGNIKSTGWTTSIPSLSNDGEFFPGVSKSWAYTFMVNDEDTPTGRPAGSLAWTGLVNSYSRSRRRSRTITRAVADHIRAEQAPLWETFYANVMALAADRSTGHKGRTTVKMPWRQLIDRQ